MRAGLILAVLVALAGGPARAADDSLQEAQNILLMLGYHPGKSDGTMRPQTTQALTEFQRASKLVASGKLDEPTMALLRQTRDTKFSGKLGAPKPGQAAERKNQVEPKPQAQPVDKVNAETLNAAPGTRVLSGSTALAAAGAVPPALFGGAPPSGSAPATSPSALSGGSSAPRGAAQPEQAPFLGLESWNWALPLLGLPLFGFLWWFGMRRVGDDTSETAEVLQVRREPNLDAAAPAPATPGRREPRL